MTRWRTAALYVFAGIFVTQLAWALAVPPFRGSDEHEHAYKAAAVAHGDWSAHHVPSQEGWGEFVTVPEDLVLAAHPVCDQLPYTTSDNCSPVQLLGDGYVTVASSASRYNPAFYWYIGSVAAAFSGATSLYAMRAAAALLCAVFIAMGVAAAASSARSRWPQLAMVVAATPVLLYSTAVAAPNGIELASALCLWATCLALVRGEGRGTRSRFLVGAAAASAILLTTVRSLGPLWLCLIVGCTFLLATPETRRRLVHRRDVRLAALAVGVFTCAALAWTLAAGTNQPIGRTSAGKLPSVWGQLPSSLVLWPLQSIAAFPLRDEAAPGLVYFIEIVAAGILLFVGIRLGSRRERWSMGLIVIVSAALPVAITIATFSQVGTAWQGRYSYPFSMGLIMLCGHAADRTSVAAWQRVALWAAVTASIGSGLVGQLHVLGNESRNSPLAGSSEWIEPSAWVLVVLAVASIALIGKGLGQPHSARAD